MRYQLLYLFVFVLCTAALIVGVLLFAFYRINNGGILIPFWLIFLAIVGYYVGLVGFNDAASQLGNFCIRLPGHIIKSLAGRKNNPPVSPEELGESSFLNAVVPWIGAAMFMLGLFALMAQYLGSGGLKVFWLLIDIPIFAFFVYAGRNGFEAAFGATFGIIERVIRAFTSSSNRQGGRRRR